MFDHKLWFITQKASKTARISKVFEPFTKRFLSIVTIWSIFDSFLQDLLLISGGCAVWNVHFFELFLMIYSFGNASYSGIELWFSLLIFLWESSLNKLWFFLESSDPGKFVTECELISLKVYQFASRNSICYMFRISFFIISLCPLESSVWFSIIAC